MNCKRKCHLSDVVTGNTTIFLIAYFPHDTKYILKVYSAHPGTTRVCCMASRRFSSWLNKRLNWQPVNLLAEERGEVGWCEALA